MSQAGVWEAGIGTAKVYGDVILAVFILHAHKWCVRNACFFSVLLNRMCYHTLDFCHSDKGKCIFNLHFSFKWCWTFWMFMSYLFSFFCKLCYCSLPSMSFVVIAFITFRNWLHIRYMSPLWSDLQISLSRLSFNFMVFLPCRTWRFSCRSTRWVFNGFLDDKSKSLHHSKTQR
jgi:hypothetical protein